MAEEFKKGTVDEDGVTKKKRLSRPVYVKVNEKEYLPSREKNTNVSYYNDEIIQLHPEHGENKRI
jgi:hypothetical protein